MDRRLKEVDKQLEEVSHHHTSLVEQAQLAFSELRKILEQKEKVCVFVFVCVCVCVCVCVWCVYIVSLCVCACVHITFSCVLLFTMCLQFLNFFGCVGT